MSTIRIQKRNHFTVVDNRTINDERLSFRARGVLVWLLSKPDDWTTTRETIARAGPEGVHVIRGVLKELQAAGYLVRSTERLPDGKLVTESILYEIPQPEADNRPAADRPADIQPASTKDYKKRLLKKTKTLVPIAIEQDLKPSSPFAAKLRAEYLRKEQTAKAQR